MNDLHTPAHTLGCMRACSFAMVMYEVFGRTLLLANRTREELDGMAMRMASGFRYVSSAL